MGTGDGGGGGQGVVIGGRHGTSDGDGGVVVVVVVAKGTHGMHCVGHVTIDSRIATMPRQSRGVSSNENESTSSSTEKRKKLDLIIRTEMQIAILCVCVSRNVYEKGFAQLFSEIFPAATADAAAAPFVAAVGTMRTTGTQVRTYTNKKLAWKMHTHIWYTAAVQIYTA